MRHVAHTVLGALAILGLASPAHAFEQTLELRPIGPAPLGSGYASVEKQYRPKVCVQFGPNTFPQGGGGTTNSFYQVLNNSELIDYLDLGVTAGFDLAISGVTVGFDFKMKFVKETSTNLFKQTVLASYTDLDAPSFIEGPITLSPEFKDKTAAQFKAACGDFLVVGLQQGREFYGTAQWEISKSTTTKDLDLATDLKAAWETGGVEAGLAIIQKYKKTDSMDKLELKIASTQGGASVQSMADFLTQYENFPKTSKKKTVKVIAVPFKDIVIDWKYNDSPLAFTDEMKLQQLVDVAYGHLSLIADLDFITVNRPLFALGSTKALSDIRYKILQGAKEKYTADLAQLRKDAKGCDTTFGTKCAAVYEKWKLWNLADQYAAIPERYTSNCEGVTIPGVPPLGSTDPNAWDLLNGQDKVIPFAGGHDGGDSFMGNNPVKVTAWLDLTPGANRKSLDAKLNVKLEEVGAKINGKTVWLQDTSFADTISGKVYDLATPASSILLGARDLNRCKFKAKPFVGKLINGHAGYIKHTTQKHPAKGESHTITPTGESGILSSISCVVAAHLGQSKKIECKAPAFKDTALALINEQDEDADEVTKGAVKKMIATIIKISTSGKAARAAKKKIVVPRGK